VLFYDHNILHRATYATTPERGTRSESDRHIDVLATLHGCMSSSSHAGPARARVILQHELDWMKTMDLAEGSRGQQMRDRLVKMAQQSDGMQLGYSLNG
jgi:hypothetical protein